LGGCGHLTAAVVADVVWDPVAWVLLGVAGPAAIGVGVLRNKPAPRWPWLSLAASILASAAADLLYTHVNDDFSTDVLTAVNLLYLGGFITATAALLRFGRSDSNGLAPAGLIDALTVTVVLLLLVWVTTISPTGPGAWAFADPALMAYPIGDALILASALRLLTAGRRTTPAIFLVAGAATALLADSLFSITGDPGARWLASLEEIGWLGYYACWGGAALHPSMTRLTQTEPAPLGELTLPPDLGCRADRTDGARDPARRGCFRRRPRRPRAGIRGIRSDRAGPNAGGDHREQPEPVVGLPSEPRHADRSGQPRPSRAAPDRRAVDGRHLDRPRRVPLHQ
jgi:hypothetical protein